MMRWAILALVLVAGFGLRLPQLDLRPMHGDEAVNAIKFKKLWEKEGYRYDPDEFHGPVLIYSTAATAAAAKLAGSDPIGVRTVRLVSVLFGAGLLLLLPLVRPALGTAAFLFSAFFLAISPVMVFYSRYYIHEMALVFFTFLFLAALWRFLKGGGIGWAVTSGAALGLMHATKETFVFPAAAACGAILILWAWNQWRGMEPMEAALKWQPRHWAILAGAAIAVSVTFYSAFFTYWRGPLDAIESYRIWFSRSGGESLHAHPWYFYLRRLAFYPSGSGPAWSEGLILALGLAGFAAAFFGRGVAGVDRLFARGMGLYTVLLAGAYAVIPYKTPWCALGFYHGLIVMAGIGAAWAWTAARGTLANAVVILGLAAGIGHLGWEAWRTNYARVADRQNPWVYAHTSPDLLNLVDKVSALSAVHPEGKKMLVKVMAWDGDHWPLPYYLRDLERVGWWQQIPEDPLAPVMIVSARFEAELEDRPDRSHLMVGFFQMRPDVFFELYVSVDLWRRYLEANPPKRDDDEYPD